MSGEREEWILPDDDKVLDKAASAKIREARLLGRQENPGAADFQVLSGRRFLFSK